MEEIARVVPDGDSMLGLDYKLATVFALLITCGLSTKHCGITKWFFNLDYLGSEKPCVLTHRPHNFTISGTSAD
jgi:hypothetical protein